MIKSCMYWGIAVFLSMLLLFVSCGDADLFDTDKWSDKIEGWEPGVSLKVIHGNFTLWDLINQGEDDVIVKEGNDLIIQYTEEGIYHIDVDEVFNMPAENLRFGCSYTIPGMQPGLPFVLSEPLEIGFETSTFLQAIPDGCELEKIEASARFVLPEIGYPYTIEAEFPDIEMNGEVLRIAKSVPATGQESVDLDNFVLTLDESKAVDLNVHIVIPEGTGVNSPDLELIFGLDDLKFKKAEGKIAVDPIIIDPDKFSMDVDFWDKIGGEFAFAEPELNIILRNKGIGVPMSVDVSFEGESSEGEKVTLRLDQGKSLTALGNSLDQVVNDTLGLDKDNSNIVAFLSLPPTGDIFYQGTVAVNPEGAENNVIYSDGEIDLDAYVRIPFKLSAESLNYKDTLKDIDIDQKYADKIKEGVITITAVNGLPLNLQIPTLVLLGENGERLESLSAVKGHETIKASNGEKSVLEFKLSELQAKKLGQTENILLEIVAFTTDKQVVTVAADAVLSFDLKIVAKAVITDWDDF